MSSKWNLRRERVLLWKMDSFYIIAIHGENFSTILIKNFTLHQMNKVKIDTRCHRHSNALTGQSAWVPVKTSATNIMFLTLHYYFLVTAVTSIFDKSVNIRSSKPHDSNTRYSISNEPPYNSVRRRHFTISALMVVNWNSML